MVKTCLFTQCSAVQSFNYFNPVYNIHILRKIFFKGLELGYSENKAFLFDIIAACRCMKAKDFNHLFQIGTHGHHAPYLNLCEQ